MKDPRAQRAQDLISLGRYDEAKRLLGVLLASEPSDAELHRLRGWACLGSGDGIEAARCGERALALDPDSAEAHRLRSLGLSAVGFDQFAVGPARRAIALDPHDSSNHAALAAALSGLGQHEAAWDAAERAVELSPDDPDMHVLMGNVAAAFPSPGAAAAAYRRALSLDPTHPVARHNLATEESQHSTVGGVQGFAAALAADPRLPEAQRNLDLLTLQMLLWVRWASQAVLVAAVLGYAFGARWLGLVLSSTVLIILVAASIRLPKSFLRSRPARLRRGLGLPSVTAVTVGAIVGFLVVSSALILLPEAGSEGASGIVLALFVIFFGIESWTASELEARHA